ncbi:MAG TPA: hypothetical protein VN976_03685 [Verrucomicrobiae bacterium]|nr:hypothetical protein [Verrucomicrobiae bacterium]
MSTRNLLPGFLLLSSVCVVAGTAGCSKQEPAVAPPTSSTASQPSQLAAPASVPAAAGPAATPMSPGTVIASAQYSADPNLRCDLLEVRRVSGGALLVRWRLTNAAGAPQSNGLVAGAAPKAIHYDFDWVQLYYTDPAENKKYAFLTDSENNRVLDMWYGDLPPGEQRLQWAKFPAPPVTSTKVTIYIPKFAPFEDTPVS